MAWETQSFAKSAFKRLAGLAHTANDRDPPNEGRASQISIAANQIIGELIDSDPDVARLVNVEYVLADLVAVSGTPLSYEAQFPSTYNGHFGTGAQDQLLRDYTFCVPLSYNNNYAESDHSGGYGPSLYKNAVRKASTSGEDWWFDPFAGVVTSEAALDLGATGTLGIYVYTGTSASILVRSTSAPTVNDDTGDGYRVGTFWVKTDSDDVYVCTDNSSGAANWEQVNAPLSSKGDLLVHTGSALTALSVGIDGKYLKADSGEASGLKWDTAASDASDLTYTPDVATDWDGDADPGNVNDALDQLAERVDDNEILLADHHDRHDPNDGADALDCAAPPELVGVQASGEGSAHSFARSDHAHQIQHSIADDHLVTVDDADAADNDFAKFTADGLEGRSYAETLSDLSGQASSAFNWPTDVKITFRDSDIFIHSNADGEMTIEADTQVTIGVAGEIKLGDATQRDMYPATNKKIDLGTNTNKFNEGWFGDVCDFSESGGRTIVSEANTSNPPTDANLDAAFGTPANAGSGFFGILDDNGADANVYLCFTNGTSWWYVTATKAV